MKPEAKHAPSTPRAKRTKQEAAMTSPNAAAIPDGSMPSAQARTSGVPAAQTARHASASPQGAGLGPDAATAPMEFDDDLPGLSARFADSLFLGALPAERRPTSFADQALASTAPIRGETVAVAVAAVDAKSRSVRGLNPAQEPLAAFEARLSTMMLQGKADSAGSLWAERALGRHATPSECAAMLERLAVGAAWGPVRDERSLRGLRGDGQAGPSAAAALQQFRQAVGRDGAALLASPMDRQARSHALGVLGAAYDMLTVRLPRSRCPSWAQDEDLRPWFQAVIERLPDEAARPEMSSDEGMWPEQRPIVSRPTRVPAPWAMAALRPLLRLQIDLGLNSLLQPLLEAALIARAPKATLMPGPESAMEIEGAPWPDSPGARLASYLPDLIKEQSHETLDLEALGALGRAGVDVVEVLRTISRSPRAPGFGELMKNVSTRFKKEEPAELMRLFQRISDQLTSAHVVRCAAISHSYGVRRPTEIYAAEGDPLRQRSEVRRWFKAIIAELRPEEFVREREALVRFVQALPATALKLGPMKSPISETTFEALRNSHIQTLAHFYIAYWQALYPSVQYVRVMTDLDLMNTGVRELSACLLAPRLGWHTAMVQREAQWLAQQGEKLGLAMKDRSTSASVLREIIAELRHAVGLLKERPAWVSDLIGPPPEDSDLPDLGVTRIFDGRIREVVAEIERAKRGFSDASGPGSGGQASAAGAAATSAAPASAWPGAGQGPRSSESLG